MKTTNLLIGLSTFALATHVQAKKDNPPNIIYIIMDDLGYGDIGCYGQEKIETPNIDLLYQNGMHFTQHYSGSPVSAPARCVLMTGMHSGHAQIRANARWPLGAVSAIAIRCTCTLIWKGSSRSSTTP